MIVCFVFVSEVALSNELIVSAAASLTDVFRDLIKSYEKIYPQSNIVLNLGGSGALLQQIYKGAPVDVYASANMVLVKQAITRGALSRNNVKVFASNKLVLVAPKNQRGLRVKQLSDLKKEEVERVAVSNYGVPVGKYTIDFLKNNAYWEFISPKIINTNNVRQSLAYVLRGEVDAGFVYSTDAATVANRIELIEVIPTIEKIVYPIGIVESTKNKNDANQFMNFVLSPEGKKILLQHGFLDPD